ncbi:hypothetical protein I7I53_07335 [Histoplasma capsulatum var. duboisii H88]|uniref:Uncharacterized protein n=1 Tax=Ajellomyces capsulatus (strain H88) TaxID=544711 RepID=A0A8A1LGX0_AJEC8|nr:hypothetical protein I7I53_07335 [Histoplasma capsulatum var. duboisii H88]
MEIIYVQLGSILGNINVNSCVVSTLCCNWWLQRRGGWPRPLWARLHHHTHRLNHLANGYIGFLLWIT